mmetsp:Transcript_63748/g.149431  ORF Transcript_63748/g.149431 Transcript_63748/m.149431 type:complete len:153 (+) Transcript_63748:42-500(+)
MWLCFNQSAAGRGLALGCYNQCALQKDEDAAQDPIDALDTEVQLRPCLDDCATCGEVTSLPSASRSQSSETFWEQFQGAWYRMDDNRCVGEVIRNSMVWHLQWNMPEAETPLERVNDEAVMHEVEGHILLGRVRRDAQMTIHWSDGDIWLLK